jgi:hypothetical protein
VENDEDWIYMLAQERLDRSTGEESWSAMAKYLNVRHL